MRASSETVSSLNGISHLLHAGRVLGGRELLRRDARHRLLDRRLSLGRVEPLALGRREHDVQHAALLGGELRLDQVGRPLRIRSRNLELVPELAPDRHHQEDEHDDDSDPAEDNAPRMRRTHPRPARERPRSEPFVGSEPFAGRRLSVRSACWSLSSSTLCSVMNVRPFVGSSFH